MIFRPGLLLCLALTACGGGGSLDATPAISPAQGTLIGGLVQSRQGLQLSGNWAPFAGSGGPCGAVSRDGAGDAARFVALSSSTFDGARLYAVDGQTIRIVDTASGVVGTLTLRDPGGQERVFLQRPSGIVSDGTYLYVADMGAHVVWKILAATGTTAALAGSGDAVGAGALAQPGAPVAALLAPRGITVVEGQLYVTDRHGIRRIDSRTGALTTWVPAIGMLGSDMVRFDAHSVTTDGLSLYVADAVAVLKLDLGSRTVQHVAGAFLAEPPVDGIGERARFGDIRALLSDGRSLFVMDHGNRSLRRLMLSSGEVSTLDRLASATPPPDDAAVGSLATDGKALFALDRENCVIVKLRSG